MHCFTVETMPGQHHFSLMSCLHYCPPSKGWGKVIVSVCSHLGGYPISVLGRGVPHPRSRWGGTPSQVQVEGYPIPGLGGYPIPGPGGTPGTPPPARIASTCYSYVAGGMPLAFMQEDFLVIYKVMPASVSD